MEPSSRLAVPPVAQPLVAPQSTRCFLFLFCCHLVLLSGPKVPAASFSCVIVLCFCQSLLFLVLLSSCVLTCVRLSAGQQETKAPNAIHELLMQRLKKQQDEAHLLSSDHTHTHTHTHTRTHTLARSHTFTHSFSLMV